MSPGRSRLIEVNAAFRDAGAARPVHHPSEGALVSRGAGGLPAGWALVIDAHLPFCRECRDIVRSHEALGGVLLADLPDTAMAPDALARTLARLDHPAAAPDGLAPFTKADDILGMIRTGWRWIGPGLRRARLAVPGTKPGENVYLLRVDPGRPVPDHGHDGWELTCILTGRYVDATGTYGPGDIADLDADTIHQPVAGPDEVCVCLIASMGKLRMKTVLARIAQTLVGA